MDTRGSDTTFATCAPAGGFARVGRFMLEAVTDLRLDFAQAQGSAHVVGLFRAGANQACDRNPVNCLNAADNPTATRSYSALQPGAYWLIVQSYPSTPGATTVTLSTGSVATPEICNNGIDDDGNNFIDCADSACAGNPVCAGSECVPDLNIGTLVVDGPGRTASANLATESDNYQSTCSAGQPGGDIAIALTLAEAAGLRSSSTRPGAASSRLYRMPGPGLACDANQRSCAFEDQASNSVAFVGLSAGTLRVHRQGAAGPRRVDQPALLGVQRPARRDLRQRHRRRHQRADRLRRSRLLRRRRLPGARVRARPGPRLVRVGDQPHGDRRYTAGGTLYATSCSRGTGRERVLRRR